MALTLYQVQFGPRWIVISVDDVDGILNDDIRVGDRLTFEGPGDGGSSSKLWNHRSSAHWADTCNFGPPFTVKHLGSGSTFELALLGLGTVLSPHKVTATVQSGGTTWTAQEGG